MKSLKVFMYKSGIRTFFGCAIAIIPIGTGFRASAQTPSTDPAFAVATVKPVDPSYHFDGTHFGPHINPAGGSYWYMTLAHLIFHAYDVQPFQVTGPEWTNAERFDIEARFPEGADIKDEKRMLQALLKDRFKLTFHIEKRELAGYALVVGKHGAKLTPSPTDPPEAAAPLDPGDSTVEAVPAKPNVIHNPDGSSTVDMGKGGTQTLRFDREHGAMHFELSKLTMAELAGRLSICLGKGIQRVEDETGIEGNYQLAWDCPNPAIPPPPISREAAGLPSDPQDGSSLTRSLDALGLKLEKRKVLQDVYVIDHAERPSGN